MEPVSIVIVNFNAGARLADCVTSIVVSGCPAQIIVVDNASEDDSVQRLEAGYGGLENLRIMRNGANLGFARACNIGTKLAACQYILYLNPDCVIDGNTLPALVNALKKRPDAGMAGGMLINPDGTEQAGGRRAVPTPWRALVRLSGLYRLQNRYPRIFYDFLQHHEKVPDGEMEIEATSGACMMVPRQVINDVGGFDEGYFLHVEDLDWCMRIREKGLKIIFVPAAKVVHLKGVCGRDRPIFVEWHKHRGLMRFYRKFFRDQYPSALMVAVAAGVWGHFLALAGYHVLRNNR
jgi:GT2 family glycosyltransferase